MRRLKTYFRFAAPFAALLCSTGAGVYANTAILRIDKTPQQAIVRVRTDQTGACTYHASRGATLSTDVPDVLDNGNTDTRVGSFFHGSTHVFVLGTRKGNDSLAAGATYTVAVVCGSDAQVTGTFTTPAIPWGNTNPQPVPFNRAAFGNMDYPTMNWSDGTQSAVDPVTGAEFWRLSSVGLIQPTTQVIGAGKADDLSGGAWTATGNIGNGSTCSGSGTSCTHATGGATDQLFVPMPNVSCSQGGTFGGNFVSGGAVCTVEDLLVDVYCGNAAASGVTLTLQWSLDHGVTTVGNAITTAACPVTAPVKVGTYPNTTPQPFWKNWGFTPQRYRLFPASGTANVNGSIVTATSGSFWTDGEMGPRIIIGSTYYDITSVDSPTQLHIAQSATVSGAAWTAAASGLVITKSGATAAGVDVSVRLTLAASQSTYSDSNGDYSHMNSVPVSVTKTAGGQALPSPLTGYFGHMIVNSSFIQIYLWIPYNADGTVRNEVRPLSFMCKNTTSKSFHANGDTITGCPLLGSSQAAIFDKVDGKSWYAVDLSGQRLFKMTYDETLAGCAGFPAYSVNKAFNGYQQFGSVADDCFQYNNLTPTTAGKGLKQQMINGYQTGVNSAGQVVGRPHPNFDLGWLKSWNPATQNSGGYLMSYMYNYPEHLGVFGSFNLTTGLLTWVRDNWSGNPNNPAGRWGGIHSCAYAFSTYVWCAMNPIAANNLGPLQGSWDMPVASINRAGFGSNAAWDCNGCTGGPRQNVSLTSSDAYTCPDASTIDPEYAAFAGKKTCVQVRVSTPPCNASPDSTYTFPDGKHEKDEFPCTTPGFGVANVNASKLQDMQMGDWLYGSSNVVERMVIITPPSYNATNDITFWVLRQASSNIFGPTWGSTHNDGLGWTQTGAWHLRMAPSYSVQNSAASFAVDFSSGQSEWLKDAPGHVTCHSVVGGGASAGTMNWASEGCFGNVGTFNVSPAQLVYAPWKNFGQASSTFNGSNSGFPFQSYPNLSYVPGAAPIPYVADFRHTNGALGSGPEIQNATFGNAINPVAVAGTRKSYKLNDPTGQPLNYKSLVYHGWAGRFLLQDVSGPTTGNQADLPDYSFCIALNSNECFQGSSRGNIYVTVPGASLQKNCWLDQFATPAPCVAPLGAVTGTTMQQRLDVTTGNALRRVGFAHAMPGVEYQFSNCRATPDANFIICIGDWVDGVRNEWLAYRVEPDTASDSQVRSDFLNVPVTVGGVPWAANVRVRFGYRENGDPSAGQFRCTRYAQDCSTEIPSGAPNDPFSFTNETVTRLACADGTSCTVNIPSLPGRVLYYAIDRLDAAGNVVSTSPVEALAVK